MGIFYHGVNNSNICWEWLTFQLFSRLMLFRTRELV